MNKLQQQALRKGTQIAVYEIKEILGSNQSEITYRAWNEHLNTTVLIKEFFPFDYVVRDHDDQFVRENSKKDMAVFKVGLNNFIQENEKLLGIQHPGVQSAHNVLEFNHTAYLAVDDEQGTSLSEQLKKSKTFNEEELRILLTSLLNALQNTHEAGIIHGDIHPDNILIRKDGGPVLLNFAAARQGFAKQVKMIPLELHAGYAPPEQYEKDGNHGTSVDLYSLGATLYRCITHTDPVAASQRMSDLSENKSDPLKPILGQTEPGFSEELLKTITWMLEPDIKDRPQSVSDVLIELNKDNKNLKALETAYPAKIETHISHSTASEAKDSHISAFDSFVGMVGTVIIGSALIWYLQQGDINSDFISSEPAKQIAETPLEQETVNDNVGETPVMQNQVTTAMRSTIESNQDVQGFVKVPEQSPVNSVQKQETTAKVESISDPLSLPEPLAETDSSNQNIIAVEPLVENKEVPVKPEPVKPEQEISKSPEKTADLIKRHLESAEQKFAKFRLTTPSEDNAYSHYQAVLEIEPDHQGARNGLRRIVDLYILLIDKAVQSDRVSLAHVYLDRAISILPNSPYLKKKSDELANLEQLPQDADQ